VDCKFLNFGVNIAKALKLHGLKVNFPEIKTLVTELKIIANFKGVNNTFPPKIKSNLL
jgi:hypothetical protein